VGSRNPLHSTAIGKALLAFAPREVVETYLAGPLERRTPNTITEPDRLAEEIAATRARGYAIDDIENEEGVRCLAAPVRDHAGKVVASLSVAAPAYRFQRSDLPAVAPMVMAAAAELSARLGHSRRRGEGEEI
jgi:DNA-binding IclR family transcriptional regulator